MMKMKKLHQYMLKSYLGPFVFTFFVALFILLMQFLWTYIDDLVGKGLEWYVIFRLLFYASATFVPMALPLAVLLSSLMTFGNLGEHYELVAAKSAGISLRRLMRPLTWLAVFISIFALLFSNYVFPVAYLKFGSLLYDVRQKKLAFDIKEGIFNNDLDGYVMRVGRKARDNKTIYDILIYDHSKHMGNVKVTTADKGIMELTPDQQKVLFKLYDGYSYTEVTDQKNYRKTRPFEYMKFKNEVLVFDLSQLNLNRTDEALFRNHYSMLNIKQLNKTIDSLTRQKVKRGELYRKNLLKRYKPLIKLDSVETDKTLLAEVVDTNAVKTIRYPLLANMPVDGKLRALNTAISTARNRKDNVLFTKKEMDSKTQLITKHEIVWHRKFRLSVACLIFFFIGAPLGAIIRKGGLGFPVVISVVFFVFYHVITMIGEKAAKTGEWSVFWGMWTSTLIILPIGLFLTYKATTDAPLLDSESWKRFFERLGFVNKLLKKMKIELKW